MDIVSHQHLFINSIYTTFILDKSSREQKLVIKYMKCVCQPIANNMLWALSIKLHKDDVEVKWNNIPLYVYRTFKDLLNSNA